MEDKLKNAENEVARQVTRLRIVPLLILGQKRAFSGDSVMISQSFRFIHTA